MSEATQRFSEELRSRVDSSKAAGMTAVYQFVMSDVPDGEVHADFANGEFAVAEGRSDHPSITLTATAADWLAILHGDLGGQMAFLTGKLKIQGDMTLAMKLQSIFRIA